MHAPRMRFALIGIWLAHVVACGGVQTGQPLQSTQDVDHDDVPDVIDKCPYNPGPDVNSGCPMQRDTTPSGGPDRENDGVPDAVDRCPDQPEDRDAFQDEDGCPEPDNDQDGVVDVVDRCPNEPARTPDGCATVNAPPPLANPPPPASEPPTPQP